METVESTFLESYIMYNFRLTCYVFSLLQTKFSMGLCLNILLIPVQAYQNNPPMTKY